MYLQTKNVSLVHHNNITNTNTSMTQNTKKVGVKLAKNLKTTYFKQGIKELSSDKELSPKPAMAQQKQLTQKSYRESEPQSPPYPCNHETHVKYLCGCIV